MAEALKDRQYHGDASSSHPLTNDDRERVRLRRQHIGLLALMHGKPIHAPIADLKPTKIADIGCGVNADMTIYLANMFPEAKVHGVDLSPIDLPKDLVPRNVEFIQGNMRDLVKTDGRLEAGSFDYVYSRLIVGGGIDWEDWIKNTITPLLKPGGWIGIHDQDNVDWYDEDHGLISRDWPWVVHLTDAWENKLGIKFHQLQYYVEDYFDKAELVDGRRTRCKLPWAPVPGKPETDAYAAYAPSLRDAMINAIGMMFSGAEKEKLRAKLIDDVGETLQKTEGMWTPFYVAWARKVE